MIAVAWLTAAGGCGRGQRAADTASGDDARVDAPAMIVQPDATPDSAVKDITAGMVRIPAGPRFLWCDKAQEPACIEPDPRPTTVGEFYIDRTEVTVAAYRRCVDEGLCGPTVEGEECPAAQRNWELDRSDHPINCVTADLAELYCRARGKHLPTDTQWVGAARGPDDLRPYPWGKERPSCKRAVMAAARGGASQAGCGTGGTLPVGSRPAGASPYGVLDLAGNVAEFTIGDRVGVDRLLTYDEPLPVSSHGGSFLADHRAFELRVWDSSSTGTAAYARNGFRCAYMVPGSDEWKRNRLNSL